MKEGWEIMTLEEVCIKITDGSHNPPKGVINSDFMMLSSKNIFNDYIHYNEPRYLTEYDFENENKRTNVQHKDVLLTIVGTIGRVAVVPEHHPKFTLQRSVAVLRSKENKLNSRFLMFLLQNTLKFLTEEARGVAQKGIYLNQLRNIEILVPPLAEQQRIVEILDEAFSAIDKAKANAEKNLKNAKELFESYLQGVFENKGDGWEEKTLDEIIESNVIGLTRNSGEQSLDYEYKYVKMNNITRYNNFDLSKFTCVNATKEEARKYTLAKGDFLFNTRNSYELVGKTCLFEGYDKEVLLYNNNIMRIRFIKSINPYFINYSFTTKGIIKKLESLKSGTTNVSAIYYKDLKYLNLAIPPINDQQTIVKKLDALSAETKKLEFIYQQKLADLEELKKSILQKAFNGELNTANICA